MELRVFLEEEVYWKLALHAKTLGMDPASLASSILLDSEQGRFYMSGVPLLHTVVAGDTLAKLAEKYLGDVGAWRHIWAANQQWANSDRLRIGQVLALPIWAPKRWWRPVSRWWDSTRYYQFGSLYANGPYKGLPHPGLDIPGDLGAPVYAAGDGRVIRNKHTKTGYGHYLMIEHEESGGRKLFSLYAHLAADHLGFVTPTVHTVIRGNKTQIGEIGRTGTSIVHLHLEMKRTPELGLYKYLPGGLEEYWVDPRSIIGPTGSLYMPWW